MYLVCDSINLYCFVSLGIKMWQATSVLENYELEANRFLLQAKTNQILQAVTPQSVQ